nr:Tc toxin subunit A [uncultured Pseudomonas sp.]
MDEHANRLLLNLVKDASSTGKKSERVSFANALEQLGYRSIFDILRTPKTSFLSNLRRLSDANGELAYENARCYATQIARLYRNELISSGGKQTRFNLTGIRSLVDIGPSFQNLFSENWDIFCKVGAIEAMDSPVAYLSSLYRFATVQLEGSSNDARRILLEARRPDIKNLKIDQDSTFRAIPMLDIVSDVLESGIRAYVDRDESADKDKSIHELVAQKKHPFLFPYNFYHHQVKLGLAEKKLTLGELSHRISRKLPIYGGAGSIEYGTVGVSSDNAHLMLTGFGPEQLNILGDVAWPAPDDTEGKPLREYFIEHYGTELMEPNPLTYAKEFMAKTGLSAFELESLLAVKSQAPIPSKNALALVDTPSNQYGASFVNVGPESALSLSGTGTAGKIDNATHNSFDRFQRFIRLQRWMDIPWAELDSLVIAIPRLESNGWQKPLSKTVIRGLGIFRYLHEARKIKAEEFAGIIDRIAIFSTEGKTSLFDKIYNGRKLFDTPLVLDNRELTLPLDPVSHSLIANGIGMEATDPLFTELLQEAIAAVKNMNNQFVSLPYRQVRIANMFGWSLKDLRYVASILGGQDYLDRLKTRGIVNVDNRTQPDIFDVMMQCDWAAAWIAKSMESVSELQQILNGNAEKFDSLITAEWGGEQQVQATSLAAKIERAKDIDIPPLTFDGAPAEAWKESIYIHFLDPSKTFITTSENIQETIRVALGTLTGAHIGGIPWTEYSDLEGKLDLISSTFVPLHAEQTGLIETMLSNVGIEPQNSAETLRYVQATSASLLATALTNPGEFVAQLKGIFTLSALESKLKVSRPSFLAFAAHPAWLDPAVTATLSVTLASVYLLDSFSRWIKRTQHPQQSFIDYLEMANAITDDPEYSIRCAEVLAPLLDFPVSEVLVACAEIEEGIAKCMADVDWLLRVKDTCDASGLSVSHLLLATSLTPDSPSADWQTVGSAAVAASRE